VKAVHRSFDDPPRLARDAPNEKDALGHYRRVRDEIRQYVETLPDSLEASPRAQTRSLLRHTPD
jgi:arsenate reductase